VDTYAYLTPKLSKATAVLGYGKRITGITAHASKRIPRLGATKHLTDRDLHSLSWKKLGTTTITDLDDDDGDTYDRDGYIIPGERVILVANTPRSWWGDGYRRFNCTAVIYMAAVFQGYDDHGTEHYTALTVLPSIYTKDEREPPQTRSPSLMRFEGDLGVFSQEQVTEAIDSWLYIVREGYDYGNGLGIMGTVLDYASYEIIADQFRLLSTPKIRKCYACHRSWRGDQGSPCCGTVCAYVGKVPLHRGYSLTSAIHHFLLEGGPGFTPARVTTGPGPRLAHQDEFALRRYTRCMYSGKAFVCTNIAGELMRPRMLISLTEYDIDGEAKGSSDYLPSCVACFTRLYCAGQVHDVKRLSADDVGERFLTVNITDVDAYKESLNSLFCGVEVPTVLKKSQPFSFGMQVTPHEASLYISSAQGMECHLVMPDTVNCGNGVTECDAWENQSSMSFAGTNVHSSTSYNPYMGNEDDRCVLRKGKKDISNATDKRSMLNHLGPGSAELDHMGRELKITPNTRFVIDNSIKHKGDSFTSYSPVYNQYVMSQVKNWLGLEGFPESYIMSLYHALVHYRYAIKAVIEYTSSAPPSMSTGALLGADSYEKVCAELLVYGIGSIFKFTRSAFTPASFGKSDINLVASTMRKTNADLTERLVASVVGRFTGDSQLRTSKTTDQWNLDRATNAVKTLSEVMGGVSGYMESVHGLSQAMVSGKSGSGTPSAYQIKNTAGMLTKTSVKMGDNYYLRQCALVGVPDAPQRLFRDLWEENFLFVREDDPRISDDPATYTGSSIRRHALPTPLFIQGEAGRFSPSKNLMDFKFTTEQVEDRVRLYAKFNVRNLNDDLPPAEYMDTFKTCFLIWDNGPVVTFEGSGLRMRWGDNLRMSTLLATKMVGNIQQGRSSEVVVCLRNTQVNALQIMMSEKFGS